MRAPDRPSVVLVVAILQICFGSLGLVGSLCGGAIQLAGGAKAFTPQPPPGAKAPAQPDVEAIMRKRMPYYGAIQGGQIALSIVSGSVMLISGIGLLKMRPWARKVTIGYACYNILMTIAGVVFAVTVSVPAMKDAFEEMRADPNMAGAGPMIGMMESAATAGAYVSLILVVYPITLLVIMFLPHVREAFAIAALPPGKEDDYGDEDFDDDDYDDRRGKAPPGEAPRAGREEGIQPADE